MSFLMDASLISDVMERVKADAERECCGFILKGDKRPIIYEAENKSPTPRESFVIESQDWVKAESLAPILATYHSHILSLEAVPSMIDQKVCNAMALPMLIVSTPSGKHTWVKPGTDEFPYARRPYAYGVFDCYTLVQDYYAREFKLEIPDIPNEFGWWEKGIDLFGQNFAAMGCVKVPNALVRIGDVIVMQMESRVPDHLAIYYQDCEILHHTAWRLSGTTRYGSFWRERTRYVLRHKSRLLPGDVYYDTSYGQEKTLRWSP